MIQCLSSSCHNLKYILSYLSRGELLQEVVELLLHIARQHRLQVVDVRLGVVEVLQELETIRQAGKDGEFTLERVLPEVQVEGGHIVYLARLPIGVGLHKSVKRDVLEAKK